jgi:hypothetical protein
MLADQSRLVVWRDRVADEVGAEDFDTVMRDCAGRGQWVVRPETEYGPAEWEFVPDVAEFLPEQMVIVPESPLSAALSNASRLIDFQFQNERQFFSIRPEPMELLD